MSLKLSGRNALVTGGARGIGRGCAIELARAGARVAFTDLHDSTDAQGLLEELQNIGSPGHFLSGDAFDQASCERTVQQAMETLGTIDILVSNPAYSKRVHFLDMPVELFEKTVRGTLFGGFYISQLVARQMVTRGGGGKIVFISSVHARVPYVWSSAYNAAKAGLNHMAFTIAAELLPYRINVNVIEPGWIDTPGEHEKFGSQQMAHAAPTLPWGRLGTPEDIGRAAVFLCSCDADYVTGTALLVDGGYWLRGATPNV